MSRRVQPVRLRGGPLDGEARFVSPDLLIATFRVEDEVHTYYRAADRRPAFVSEELADGGHPLEPPLEFEKGDS